MSEDRSPSKGQPLAGQVALVTGGSRGIGKGCALELAAAGATVYLTGRTTVEGDAPLPGTIGATAQEIEEAGGHAIAVACDHRDDAAVEAVFETIERDHGCLDILVNNAMSIPREMVNGKPFFENPLSNWDDMIDVGTRSAYAASWFACRRLMAPAKRGLIVNISSSGAAKYAWHVGYGVGKAALDKMTGDMGEELAPLGIAVVSLWPGLVLTERTKNVSQSTGLDTSKAESQRFTGRAVVALASDPAVARHNGQVRTSRALADEYRFTDQGGRLPDGPLKERPRGISPSA